jgi:hypothetical protein
MLADANPFKPQCSVYNVGDHATTLNLGDAFDDLIGLVATRNPDFYEVIDGKLTRLRA